MKNNYAKLRDNVSFSLMKCNERIQFKLRIGSNIVKRAGFDKSEYIIMRKYKYGFVLEKNEFIGKKLSRNDRGISYYCKWTVKNKYHKTKSELVLSDKLVALADKNITFDDLMVNEKRIYIRHDK